ncbi:MAG: lipid-A-disaccharide synthase [Sulfuricella sp.]|nr:lipid-A-disaccharide synthase [Sulfuricella sp.]
MAEEQHSHQSASLLGPGPVIGMVAGEASGDMLGAHLIEALRKQLPNAQFVGIGGSKMVAVGMQTLFPMEKLAVRGYIEVLRHFREILGIRNKLIRYFRENPPDVFIGVDAPDFNLALEKALKKRGTPTIHYVSPSIWAWRGERIHKIAKSASHVMAIFPFEKPLYDAIKLPCTYVGHPLADFLPDSPNRFAMREQLHLSQDAVVFAMLPGSRQSELQYMAELYIRTAQEIAAAKPHVHFLVPLVSRETRSYFEEILYRLGAQDLPLTILFGHAHDAMIAADVVLVASGTATLEAALLGRPMVITYKMPPASYRIMKRKGYLPYVGLPNILAGKFVVPEILQDDATPENLAQALLNEVSDPVVGVRLANEFARIRRELKQDTAEKAVEALLPYLKAGR